MPACRAYLHVRINLKPARLLEFNLNELNSNFLSEENFLCVMSILSWTFSRTCTLKTVGHYEPVGTKRNTKNLNLKKQTV